MIYIPITWNYLYIYTLSLFLSVSQCSLYIHIYIIMINIILYTLYTYYSIVLLERFYLSFNFNFISIFPLFVCWKGEWWTLNLVCAVFQIVSDLQNSSVSFLYLITCIFIPSFPFILYLICSSDFLLFSRKENSLRIRVVFFPHFHILINAPTFSVVRFCFCCICPPPPILWYSCVLFALSLLIYVVNSWRSGNARVCVSLFFLSFFIWFGWFSIL